MRIAQFIAHHIEPILVEWEAFARTIWPPGGMADPAELRDHAEQILHAVIADMATAQSLPEQSSKSMGQGAGGRTSDRLDHASKIHGAARAGSGLDLPAVVAEYRALRAVVLRLWRAATPTPDVHDLDDVTRFNEAIDQSLALAVTSFTRRLDATRTMFLAILGHDLRNPLNAIMLSAMEIAMDGNDAANTAACASQIRESGQAMAGMIGDLLDFTSTRLGAGIPVEAKPIDLESLCQEVFNECQAANPRSSLRLQSDGPLAAQADPQRLRQAIGNLVGNAAQHGQSEGPIDLSLKAEGSTVLIAVHNKGRAIPPDSLATIFDPLVCGPDTDPLRKRRPGSIGLGLYIAREVATAHGGSIDVTSSEQDGTRFTLRLPSAKRVA